MRKINRSRRGFALVAVLSVSFVMLLIASAMFAQVSAVRRDSISSRASTDTLYAAEAGLQTLIAQINAQSFGTNAVTLSSLALGGQQFITSSNLTQSQVSADVANGTLTAGSAYTPTGGSSSNAMAQILGTGTSLGYLVYSAIAYNSAGTVITPTFPLSSSVARLDVKVIGFKGRLANSQVSASITVPSNSKFFVNNPYGLFADYTFSQNGGGSRGSTFSAKPFCFTQPTNNICPPTSTFYLYGIYKNGSTVTYMTDAQTSPPDGAAQVTGIYQSGSTICYQTASSPCSGSAVTVTGTLGSLSYPSLAGSCSPSCGSTNFYPVLPSGAIKSDNTVDSTYSLLPAGNQGNIGSSNSGNASTAISIGNSANNQINGSVYVNCATTSCISSGKPGAITGTINTIAPVTLSVPLVPSTATVVSGTVPTTLKGATGNTSTNYYSISESLLNGQSLNIDTSNGKVVLYITGNTLTSGSVTINTAAVGRSADFQLYSASALTIDLDTKNSNSNGLYFAPKATLSQSGNGKNALIGAYIFKSITVNGNPNFTYDESLAGENLPLNSQTSSKIGNWRRL